ncbi:MAG: beta-ketoacyl-ACP synthase II [Planctomycetota bacterium]|jgi:3-oxoacyl-[acyl-carrier-protein] synthase II
MDKRRVVITGLGAVTPLGLNVIDYWQGLLAGTSGIDTITHFDAGAFSSRIAGEVKNFAPSDYFDVRLAKRLDRFSQLAMVAGIEAVKDSGLDFAREDPRRAGVIVGSGIGGLQEIEDQHSRLLKRGPGKLSPFMVPKLMMNAASGQLSIYFGLRGISMAIASACASATNSIGEAAWAVRRGDADILLAGGSEAAVTPLGLGGFCALKALSTRNDEPELASRPFDADRDGFVLGEGAAVAVLEEYEHARKRGARVYVELAGYGASDDAYHLTAPDPNGAGAAEAMENALADAAVAPETVDYVNAHGTATEFNDIMETQALKQVFGEYARRLVVSSTKSMTGHLLGASGAIELVACALAIENGVVPPTINLDSPDPQCDLDYTPKHPREMPVNVAISNSFGFGGHNACLVLRKPA